VQGVLNEIFGTYYRTEIKACGASRTDKGVHANGQILHFDLPHTLNPAKIRTDMNNLNIRLPDDVKIMDMWRAPRGTLDIQVDMNMCV
jgi:tRNA pseudouridine38-40 synthase